MQQKEAIHRKRSGGRQEGAGRKSSGVRENSTSALLSPLAIAFVTRAAGTGKFTNTSLNRILEALRLRFPEQVPAISFNQKEAKQAEMNASGDPQKKWVALTHPNKLYLNTQAEAGERSSTTLTRLLEVAAIEGVTLQVEPAPAVQKAQKGGWQPGAGRKPTSGTPRHILLSSAAIARLQEYQRTRERTRATLNRLLEMLPPQERQDNHGQPKRATSEHKRRHIELSPLAAARVEERRFKGEGYGNAISRILEELPDISEQTSSPTREPEADA